MKDNTYIFICNNDKWNFFDNVKKEGHIEPWKCTKSVKLGDKFYIHLGGNSIKEKGIIATGTVVSESYIDIEEDGLVADLKIEKIFDKPVLKFKQGMYQVQGSCARLREEIIEEMTSFSFCIAFFFCRFISCSKAAANSSVFASSSRTACSID